MESTFMNSFLFIISLYFTVLIASSVLYSRQKDENFMYPDLPHIPCGCVCIWDHKVEGYIWGKNGVLSHSLWDIVSLIKESHACWAFEPPTGSYFCHSWCHRCQIALGAELWERGEKEKNEVFHSFSLIIRIYFPSVWARTTELWELFSVCFWGLCWGSWIIKRKKKDILTNSLVVLQILISFPVYYYLISYFLNAVLFNCLVFITIQFS